MLEIVAERLFRIASFKKALWRVWYRYLARVYQGADWEFMNYGFAGDNGNLTSLALDEADEANRYCIQLYHHLASHVVIEGRKVLELGSGRGGGASYLSRYQKPSLLLGIDMSEPAVALSQNLSKAEGSLFVCGDAELLPLANDSIDVALSIETMHCFGSIESFLAEVRRVLRPGGHLLVADIRLTNKIPAIRRAFERGGFPNN